jgi:thioredoxin-like negative regulator of GroEL
MIIKDIFTIEEFNDFIASNEATVVYFSTPECNVCKVLKPKLIEMLKEKFSLFSFAYVDCNTAKELSAQNSIFSVPTIIFYIQGRELFRKSRNINLSELEYELERPYSFIQ